MHPEGTPWIMKDGRRWYGEEAAPGFLFYDPTNPRRGVGLSRQEFQHRRLIHTAGKVTAEEAAAVVSGPRPVAAA